MCGPTAAPTSGSNTTRMAVCIHNSPPIPPMGILRTAPGRVRTLRIQHGLPLYPGLPLSGHGSAARRLIRHSPSSAQGTHCVWRGARRSLQRKWKIAGTRNYSHNAEPQCARSNQQLAPLLVSIDPEARQLLSARLTRPKKILVDLRIIHAARLVGWAWICRL